MKGGTNERAACRAISVEKIQYLTLRLLAKAWNIPKSTIQRCVRGLVKGFHYGSGKKPLLCSEAENSLTDFIKVLGVREAFRCHRHTKHCLSVCEVQSCERFLREETKAGYYLCEDFLRRNQHLSIHEKLFLLKVILKFVLHMVLNGSAIMNNFSENLRSLMLHHMSGLVANLD